ncbi:unnamed protein product [Spirodela intermedia]|uniref:Uncharacterized protein n=1 Tax=Spirodela intermedia TaxID=51605 RepID=A0A7I8L0C6_SPIIN|nr:unnamed protein product [Spirodela intermedia]
MSAGESLLDEAHQIPIGRAAFLHRLAGPPPPDLGSLAHGLPALPLAHDQVEAPPQLSGVRQTLGCGVPPAVRHEAAHRAVGEHLHLRAPLHHHPLRALLHPLPAPPRHPQVRPLAVLQRAGDLLPLSHRQHRVAPEGDVNHRAVRLGVQPRRVALSGRLLEEVATEGGLRPVEAVSVGRRQSRSNWEELHRLRRLQIIQLQGLEGVDQNSGLGVHGLEELLHQGKEQVVLRVPGEEQGGDVADGVLPVGLDEAGMATEVEVVDGEDGGGLDPIQGGGDAEVARHGCRPGDQEIVDDASHRATGGGEVARELGEGPATDGLQLLQEVVPVDVDPVDVPVVLPDGVGGASKQWGKLSQGNAAVDLRSGGEGDLGTEAGEALAQLQGGVDVALRREGHHQEVLLRLIHGRSCRW